MLIHFFNLIFFLFLMSGCSVKPVSTSENRIDRLAKVLQKIGGAPYKNSRELAEDIALQTKRLVKEFELTSPPLWHNFLVNAGFKKRGLCYHWSDDLYLYFYHKNYKYFSFYLAGADIGDYFGEHNALIVVPKGASGIKNGVVIDPWRASGKLYFNMVENETEYLWRRRAKREIPSSMTTLPQALPRHQAL